MIKCCLKRFNISNVDHYLGIISLTSTAATINISSVPQQATFSIGEEKKFDVTSDNYYDVYVKLNGIKLGLANITIKSIHEAILTSTQTQQETTTQEESQSTTENETTQQQTLEGKTNTLFWLVIIVIAIIIVVIIAFLIKGKKNKRYHFYGY